MKINLANIKKAKKLLDKRECVAVPTETVYGLAGNAYSDQACKKIFKLKKRPKNNPLIVHYFNIKKLMNDCKLNSVFLKLYDQFCPGPITFILKLKKNSKISKVATNKKGNLAIRFPKHPIIRNLLKQIEYPLAAPSANISSKVSAVSSADVKEDFGKKIKYILEGGKSSIGVESTIIDLKNKPTILRLGGIEIASIEKVLKKKIIINDNPKKISAPGQSKLHYSPGIPVRLNVEKIKNDEAYLLIKNTNKVKPNYYFLSKKGDLKEAARNLYSTLRKIKKAKYKSIAVQKIPNKGLGKTINDRLLRASKY
ncbi:threonylcarbamoyl-AMP synthase [Pelagibacterales bacterium SAG-MED13]|nr:threonylcarbamoyl-AMP synthase [Pelagibacterales bacterium SAG-MED13]|tara:strand:- start:297 stop:1229 length:933 start_codon:yes stop_codon:yes gene_type:complete